MRYLGALVLVASVACGPSKSVSETAPTHESDDRPALQAAIDLAAKKGIDLELEARTYTVSQVPGAYWCLDIPGHVRIHGAGEGETVLRVGAHVGPSVRLLHVTGDDVLIEDVTLDGNKREQTVDAQRHGIFAENTRRLVVRKVAAENFSGDGFYLYNGTSETMFTDVVSTANGRNGITFGANVDGTTLKHSRFLGNQAQQVDSEPGGLGVVSNTTIADCLLDGAGASDDYVLTVSGTDMAAGHDWKIVGNTINGATFVVWASHVAFEGNIVSNSTTKAAVTIYRSSSDVRIVGNRINQTQSTTTSDAGILVLGTGTGQAPAGVLVAQNDIEVTYEKSFGIRVEGALDVTILDNRLHGSGRSAAYYAGIYLRATNDQEPFRSAVVRGNSVKSFGERGVSIHGNGQAKLLVIDVSNNSFGNDEASAPMTTAISLDDGNGPVVAGSVHNNTALRGVTSLVINHPNRAALSLDAAP